MQHPYKVILAQRTTALFLLLFLSGQVAFGQIHSIILARPTDTSMTASIMFSQASDFYFRYGNSPGRYTDSTAVMNAPAGTPVTVDMTNLTADTRYYYSVQ